MRSIAKALLPTFLQRHLRALLVHHNRRTILRRSASAPCTFLKPVNRVEHFYHFLFDLTLPLWCLIRHAPPDAVFAVKSFGLFTERLSLLFPGRVYIEDDQSKIDKLPQESLLGMNSRFVHLLPEELDSFKQYVCKALNIEPVRPPNKVLLIERLPPDRYWVEDAVKKGCGTSRRSIPNHAELAAALDATVKDPYEFHNVQLEKLPFVEQVRLFDQAALVIGQHGAGLANCVWMQPNGIVVELSNNVSLDHFRVISRVRRCKHIVHQTSGAHSPVNVVELISLLLSDGWCRDIFEQLGPLCRRPNPRASADQFALTYQRPSIEKLSRSTSESEQNGERISDNDRRRRS